MHLSIQRLHHCACIQAILIKSTPCLDLKESSVLMGHQSSFVRSPETNRDETEM